MRGGKGRNLINRPCIPIIIVVEKWDLQSISSTFCGVRNYEPDCSTFYSTASTNTPRRPSTLLMTSSFLTPPSLPMWMLFFSVTSQVLSTTFSTSIKGHRVQRCLDGNTRIKIHRCHVIVVVVVARQKHYSHPGWNNAKKSPLPRWKLVCNFSIFIFPTDLINRSKPTNAAGRHFLRDYKVYFFRMSPSLSSTEIKHVNLHVPRASSPR